MIQVIHAIFETSNRIQMKELKNIYMYKPPNRMVSYERIYLTCRVFPIININVCRWLW